MPTFQVRNKRTKMVLGEVDVADPERVLDELAMATGCTIEEIAQSLGTTAEEAKAALDIVPIQVRPEFMPRDRVKRPSLPPRGLFA